VPGVGLISPPPHHDIYSIEDLAQLIHDLKNVNPTASISVKLVSEVGIGTVAAGVSKAKADHVVVAGHDGGTGASPLSSIKHAGTPWELGLAETQQTLVLNGLRSRIRVQADGQMKTGRDVVIAAMLGADEIGFATAPLVVEGCIMMRKCHLNTCPVGVATQDPVLRAKFQGKPEHVVNYFFFVAEEARQLMAQLGIRTYDELIGRADLLDKSKAITHWKAQGLDFARIFYQAKNDGTPRNLFHTDAQDHGLDRALDHKLMAQAGRRWKRANACPSSRRSETSTAPSAPCCRARSPSATATPACRTTPSTSSCKAPRASRRRLPGAGITLDLVGEGNDYVGKGLSGGRVIVRPNTEFRGWAVDNIIVGNTVLYGAIAGEAFSTAWPASASRCATRARLRWWRAAATTAAST
jgi:glutamate synthase (NADPH/NADH) large chain